jgi:Spy/CpxP family protein refolding chaperone
MLRKLLSLGALVVVAASFAAAPASAKKDPAPPKNVPAYGQDGFSDGRL